jgi:hypothetical protein
MVILCACQIEGLGDAPRAAAVPVATLCARAGCHAVSHQGVVTLDGTSPVSWHRESKGRRQQTYTCREAVEDGIVM